jgi:hypothetical protein
VGDIEDVGVGVIDFVGVIEGVIVEVGVIEDVGVGVIVWVGVIV